MDDTLSVSGNNIPNAQYEWEVGSYDVVGNPFFPPTNAPMKFLSGDMNTFNLSVYTPEWTGDEWLPRTILIQRKITIGDQISYSNRITLPVPKYNGPNLDIQLTPNNFQYGDSLTIQITNPQPNVRYRMIAQVTLIPQQPSRSVTYAQSNIGSRFSFKTVGPRPFGMVYIYGSDGSNAAIDLRNKQIVYSFNQNQTPLYNGAF